MGIQLPNCSLFTMLISAQQQGLNYVIYAYFPPKFLKRTYITTSPPTPLQIERGVRGEVGRSKRR